MIACIRNGWEEIDTKDKCQLVAYDPFRHLLRALRGRDVFVRDFHIFRMYRDAEISEYLHDIRFTYAVIAVK